MIQHQPRIHGRLVVNIFHLVIVLLHDNRIDGQLPNDLKTHLSSSLLSPSFSSCVCKRYQTVRVSMSICSTVEFRFVSLRACFGFFFFQVSRFSLFCYYAAYLVFHFDIGLTAITHSSSCSFLFLFVIGLIDFYSLRMLVYVCLSVYILHQFVTVVDRYIK